MALADQKKPMTKQNKIILLITVPTNGYLHEIIKNIKFISL